MRRGSDRKRRAREADAEADAEAEPARNEKNALDLEKTRMRFHREGSIVPEVRATRARASPRARRRARRSSRVVDVRFVANQAGDARFPSPWQPARRPRGQKPPRLSPVPAREARRARRARALLALRRALRPGGSCGRAGTRPARPRRHPAGCARAAWCPRDADPPSIGAESRDGSDRGAIDAARFLPVRISQRNPRVLASRCPPRDAPRLRRVSRKNISASTFDFSASLSAAHPGAAFTRAVRPRMRPQMRARGTMQAIGVKTNLCTYPSRVSG